MKSSTKKILWILLLVFAVALAFRGVYDIVRMIIYDIAYGGKGILKLLKNIESLIFQSFYGIQMIVGIVLGVVAIRGLVKSKEAKGEDEEDEE